MSTAAVMVVRDEADIVEASVRHALWHVDEVIAADHRSVDGTREILESLPVTLLSVEERGFDGDRIWTWLGQEALKRGHDWMVVNDADDVWYVADYPTMRIGDYLRLVSQLTDYLVVSADSFNHIPTSNDDETDTNPLTRIEWHRVDADALKVACRLHPDLTYGKHNAWYRGEIAPPTVSRGLAVRHFTVRTPHQLVTKVRNGLDGYSVEAGMPEGYDVNWQQWKGLTDEEVEERFWIDHWEEEPAGDPSLVHDPAPVRPWQP